MAPQWPALKRIFENGRLFRSAEALLPHMNVGASSYAKAPEDRPSEKRGGTAKYGSSVGNSGCEAIA